MPESGYRLHEDTTHRLQGDSLEHMTIADDGRKNR